MEYPTRSVPSTGGMSSHRPCKGIPGMSSAKCIRRDIPVSLWISLPSFQNAVRFDLE